MRILSPKIGQTDPTPKAPNDSNSPALFQIQNLEFVSRLSAFQLAAAFRSTKSVALAAICSSLIGCISYSEYGTSEADSIDYEELGVAVVTRADSFVSEFDSQHRFLDKSHSAVAKATSILDEVRRANGSSPRSISGSGGISLFQDSKYTSFEYYNPDSVIVQVFVSDDIVALAIPGGHIYLSSGLLDSSLPGAVQSDSQLRAVIAHELDHLVDGHVFSQWARVDARNRVLTKQALAAILQIVPVASFDYATGDLYQDADIYDKRIEFEADESAFYYLKRRGDDPSEYVRYLNSLLQLGQESELSGNLRFLRSRVSCLEILSKELTGTFEITFEERTRQYLEENNPATIHYWAGELHLDSIDLHRECKGILTAGSDQMAEDFLNWVPLRQSPFPFEIDWSRQLGGVGSEGR